MVQAKRTYKVKGKEKNKQSRKKNDGWEYQKASYKAIMSIQDLKHSYFVSNSYIPGIL